MGNFSNREFDTFVTCTFAVLSVLGAFGRWFLLGWAINSVPEEIAAPTSVFDLLSYRFSVALSDSNFQVFCYFMIISQLATSVILLIGLRVKKSWLCVPAIVYSWIEFVAGAFIFGFLTDFGHLIAVKLFPDMFFANKTFGKAVLISIVGFFINILAIFLLVCWSNMPGDGANKMKVHFEEDEEKRVESTKDKQLDNLITDRRLNNLITDKQPIKTPPYECV